MKKIILCNVAVILLLECYVVFEVIFNYSKTCMLKLLATRYIFINKDHPKIQLGICYKVISVKKFILLFIYFFINYL